MSKNYYTYILRCADNTLYCGYTDDVEKRLATHNAGKGAKYTHGRLPVELLTFLEFPDKEEAMQCEWWIKKKLTRKQKLTFIKEDLLKEKFNFWQEARKK